MEEILLYAMTVFIGFFAIMNPIAKPRLYGLTRKLDELIRVMEGAHNALVDLEELDEKELDKIRFNYENLAKQARKDLVKNTGDTGVPQI